MRSMTLDDILTARAGEHLRITLFPASRGYQANISPDGKSWRCEMAADPATALKKALGVLPGSAGSLFQPPQPGGIFE